MKNSSFKYREKYYFLKIFTENIIFKNIVFFWNNESRPFFTALFENTAKIMCFEVDENESSQKQKMKTEIKQIWKRFGYLPVWFAIESSLHDNRFYFAPYGRFSCSTYQTFTMIARFYGHEKGLACFKSKMRVAVLLKSLSNYHLALISSGVKLWFSIYSYTEDEL